MRPERPQQLRFSESQNYLKITCYAGRQEVLRFVESQFSDSKNRKLVHMRPERPHFWRFEESQNFIKTTCYAGRQEVLQFFESLIVHMRPSGPQNCGLLGRKND